MTARLVGILNLTPNSFSDGGRFVEQGGMEDVVEAARVMLEDGAELLDVGGESTGPGSVDVSVEEELTRVIPAVERLHAAFPEALISVDTWKSEVAEAAVRAGARIINDVTAGRGDERIFEVAARYGVPIVLMYSKQNSPRTDRALVQYEDVMATIKAFLKERIGVAASYGVREVIVDPGMGAFVSGEASYSYEIIDRIAELRELGWPIWVGTSRKGFLGEDRLGMTLWTMVQLRDKVDFLRVHDVVENRSACN